MDEILCTALETGALNMRYYEEDPDPILSSPCAPFEPEEFGEITTKFSKLLIAKLQASPTGLGLAAPQVGILKRAFVMKFPDPDKQESICVFNPVVVTTSEDEWLYDEGCLSVPGVFNQVRRPKMAVVRGQTENGDSQRLEMTMLTARVALHELDHLEGTMFFDRMSKQMRKATLRNWEKERRKLTKERKL